LTCSARTPNSPSGLTAVTCSTCPSKRTPVGVTSLNANVVAIDFSRRDSRFQDDGVSARLAAREPFRLGARVVDRADQVERLLRQVVALAVENLGESTHGFLARHVSTRDAGERLRHVHRLREKALDPAGACDDQLIVR